MGLRLKLSWETEHQVRYRMQWLAACEAVRRVGSRLTGRRGSSGHGDRKFRLRGPRCARCLIAKCNSCA
jgi:hypothetical protein